MSEPRLNDGLALGNIHREIDVSVREVVEHIVKSCFTFVQSR
ncbi:unnamed protein product [Acanthoscelides obtectus]|uniref:Uncharacterized protein n=1 Tax=Acanthoscelides obtectus TaxID=200917 RepID=A0A9P0MBE5_ACAOB|nr:unnamed protein product [Acanthoscelides obtectus]CAK1622385.1 hypothetical protein AOBTE_LOCUS1459 [Acanthoscelides obtectus]